MNRRPYGPITYNCECETVARNINIIRNRLNLGFVELDAEIYKTERLKDGDFFLDEMLDFAEVMPLIITKEQCIKFSRVWKINAISIHQREKQ